MAKYYFTKKDGTKEAISIAELKVKLFSGEIEPSDVDFKSLIGASPKDKKELESTLDAVVQMTNGRKKAAEEAIAEDAKKQADAKVRDAEISKLQRKGELANGKATRSAEELNVAKRMLDDDPGNAAKVEYYNDCLKQVYDDYSEAYKIDMEIQKKENPESATSIEESFKRRIKGLKLRLGMMDDSVNPAPIVSTPTSTTTSTSSSRGTGPVIEQYTGADNKVVNVCLCYNNEPISELEAKGAVKKFGAKKEDFSYNIVSTFKGKIIVGDEVPELKSMINL